MAVIPAATRACRRRVAKKIARAMPGSPRARYSAMYFRVLMGIPRQPTMLLILVSHVM